MENAFAYSLHNSPPACPRQHEGQGCLFWGVRLLSKPCQGLPTASQVAQCSLEPNIREREGKGEQLHPPHPPPPAPEMLVLGLGCLH